MGRRENSFTPGSFIKVYIAWSAHPPFGEQGKKYISLLYKRRIKQSDAAQIKNTFPENQQRAGKTAFLK
jgi:hypothetical protein